jgi:hypothetical protein
MDSNKIEGSKKHYFLRPVNRLDRHGRKLPRDDRVINLAGLPANNRIVMGNACLCPQSRVCLIPGVTGRAGWRHLALAKTLPAMANPPKTAPW